MKTLTKVTILGIVGNDPDLKQAKSGLPIASFPVATMTKKKDPQGEQYEATLWHNVVCFGKTAENVSKAVTKGSKIYVDGTIDYQEYKDSQGTSKIATKIICNDFSVVSKSEYKQSQEQLESRGNKRHTDDLFLDDSIPF